MFLAVGQETFQRTMSNFSIGICSEEVKEADALTEAEEGDHGEDFWTAGHSLSRRIE